MLYKKCYYLYKYIYYNFCLFHHEDDEDDEFECYHNYDEKNIIYR
jgi:hypothetical protein